LFGDFLICGHSLGVVTIVSIVKGIPNPVVHAPHLVAIPNMISLESAGNEKNGYLIYQILLQ